MIIGLCGKSGTGKTTVKKRMINQGFKGVVTTTTRKPREGEVDGVDYHFITVDEFAKIKEQDGFIETTSYHTLDNEEWFYGTQYKDFEGEDDKVIILNPSGLKAFKEKRIPIQVFLIESEQPTLASRLANRGDNPKEIERRMQADMVDFADINDYIDCTVYNNKDTDLDKLTDLIIGLARCGKDV